MDDERDALRAQVLDAIRSIAPEVDPAAIDGARPLRRQLDLDSMDWLGVLVALNERLGVQVSEADYARIDTLEQLVDHLRARLRRAAG